MPSLGKIIATGMIGLGGLGTLSGFGGFYHYNNQLNNVDPESKLVEVRSLQNASSNLKVVKGTDKIREEIDAMHDSLYQESKEIREQEQLYQSNCSLTFLLGSLGLILTAGSGKFYQSVYSKKAD